jgi:hypothetical protein
MVYNACFVKYELRATRVLLCIFYVLYSALKMLNLPISEKPEKILLGLSFEYMLEIVYH